MSILRRVFQQKIHLRDALTFGEKLKKLLGHLHFTARRSPSPKCTGEEQSKGPEVSPLPGAQGISAGQSLQALEKAARARLLLGQKERPHPGCWCLSFPLKKRGTVLNGATRLFPHRILENHRMSNLHPALGCSRPHRISPVVGASVPCTVRLVDGSTHSWHKIVTCSDTVLGCPGDKSCTEAGPLLSCSSASVQ